MRLIHEDLAGNDIMGDGFELLSGRRVETFTHAYSPNCDGSVSYGSDGGFDTDDWTVSERLELATFMIGCWLKWAMRIPF